MRKNQLRILALETLPGAVPLAGQQRDDCAGARRFRPTRIVSRRELCAVLASVIETKSDLYPTHGYVWWLVPGWRSYVIDAALLDEWRAGRVDQRLIEAGEALPDREIASSDFGDALAEELGENGYALWQEETAGSGLRGRRTRAGPIVGFEGNGWLGQWIVAYADAEVVAARLIDRGSWRGEADGFADFIEILDQAARADR